MLKGFISMYEIRYIPIDDDFIKASVEIELDHWMNTN